MSKDSVGRYELIEVIGKGDVFSEIVRTMEAPTIQ